MTARPLLRFHEALPAYRSGAAGQGGRESESVPQIAELIRTAKLSMVYQPIADLQSPTTGRSTAVSPAPFLQIFSR